MEERTLHVKLVAQSIDIGNYTTYVFENLEYKHYEDQYIMCVKFPNWNQSEIHIGNVGYLTVRHVKEGVSQWYDGEKMNVYKYTNIIFMKFVNEPQNIDKTFVVD
jgi:hypothetical protein